jgi:hypothetical protein
MSDYPVAINIHHEFILGVFFLGRKGEGRREGRGLGEGKEKGKEKMNRNIK